MKILGWIFRIIIVALGIGLFMLQSQYVKISILEFFLNQPFKNSALRVEVEGVRGLFPFQFEVASLALKDKQDFIASLENITAVWSVPDLLAKEVKVSVGMKNQLAGEVIYRINKHALFVGLQGDGLILWNQGTLKSLVVDLPELKLVKGKVVATFQDGQAPATLTMQLEELDEERLKVENIVLSGKGIQGKGFGIVYPKQDAWEGEMGASVQDLAFYDYWFPKSIAGSVTLTCQKKLKGQLKVDLHLDKFHYGNFTVKSMGVQALMKENNYRKLTLQGQDALINNIPLTTVTASGSIENSRGTFDFVGHGPKNISFHSQGTIDLPTDHDLQTEITFKRAELNHPQHQFTLKKPATFVWGKNVIQAQQVWLAAGSGMVSIQDLVIEDKVLSGNVLIDRLPLTILRVINPDWIASGFLTGKGNVKGTLEAPAAELSLEGKALQWGAPEKSRLKTANYSLGIDLSSTFKLSQGYLTWEVKLASGQVVALNSQGKLSVDQWYPTPTSSLEGTLKGHGDLGIISRFIQNGDLVRGRVAFDLSAKGTIKDPKVNGHVSLANGLYENAAFGTLVRNIKIEGSAVNDVINLSSMSGQDNSKGRVSGHCLVKLTSLLNPEIDLELKLDKLIVVQNDEISGKANGFLRLQGALFGDELKRAKITGDVVVQPLEIHLEDHTEKMVTIQLLEKKKDGTFQTPKERHKEGEIQKGSSTIPLDIKLQSPGEIYVRGYGLDTQWKGEMRVLGTLTDPYLLGEITLVRGKFDMLGKPLKLAEGRVSYVQVPKNDPLLALVGIREVGEITAMMRIDGRASDPKITFSSNPALPQEEVLARLLFGRGVESMSVTQSLLLANALSTFKGKNNLNFAEKIRTAFGLDVLEFKERKSTDGDEFQSPSQLVSVGKQITDNVYLSLDQSVSGDGGTTATVQYDITSSLKIEADVGGDSNTAVGFAWVKKY